MPSASTVVDPATARRMREDAAPGSDLVGRSGVPLWNGTTTAWEPNARYQHGKWWTETVPRLQVCPPVDTATSTLVDLALSATFDAGPGHEPARQLLRHQFGFGGLAPRMLDTWESLLRRLLRAVFEGAGAHEWVTEWDEYDDTAGPDGTVYLTRLHDRSHRAITAYLTDPDEQLVGVRMQVTEAGESFGDRDIPVSQLLYLCFRPRGTTDYDGHGLWRAVANDAADHGEVGNQLRAGARRYAVGDIDLTLDVEMAQRLGIQVTTEWCSGEAARMEAWARARESGQSGYVVRMPWWRLGTFGGAGSGGTGQGYNPASLVGQRDHYKATIYEQLAAEYLQIGSQGGGSYSAAEVKVSRAGSVSRNLIDWVLSELHRQVIEPLLRVNFPDVPRDELPRIVVGGLRAKAFLAAMPLVIQAKTAGLINWSAALQQELLDAWEFEAKADPSAPLPAVESPVADPSPKQENPA